MEADKYASLRNLKIPTYHARGEMIFVHLNVYSDAKESIKWMRTLTEICRDTFHAERQVAGTSAIDIQSLSQRNRKTTESAQQGHTL